MTIHPLSAAPRHAAQVTDWLWQACRNFCERYGWHYIGEGLEYPDKTVHLCRYSLADSAGGVTE